MADEFDFGDDTNTGAGGAQVPKGTNEGIKVKPGLVPKQGKECYCFQCETAVIGKQKWCAHHKRIDDVLQAQCKVKNDKGKLEWDPEKKRLYDSKLATPAKAKETMDKFESMSIANTKWARKPLVPFGEWKDEESLERNKKAIQEEEPMEETEFMLWAEHTKGWSKEDREELWSEYKNNPNTQRDHLGLRGCLRLYIHKKTAKIHEVNRIRRMTMSQSTGNVKMEEDEVDDFRTFQERKFELGSFAEGIFLRPGETPRTSTPKKEGDPKKEGEEPEPAPMSEADLKAAKAQDKRRKSFVGPKFADQKTRLVRAAEEKWESVKKAIGEGKAAVEAMLRDEHGRVHDEAMQQYMVSATARIKAIKVWSSDKVDVTKAAGGSGGSEVVVVQALPETTPFADVAQDSWRSICTSPVSLLSPCPFPMSFSMILPMSFPCP